MEIGGEHGMKTSSSSNYYSSSSGGSSNGGVMSPCAACKILRRRCAQNCVLAPYFPPTDPLKFTTAHRVFGASNIIKFIQELPEDQRADAVSSMVYEANARLRDPVYGCTGTVCQLQNQVTELQAELARAQAEILNMQCHQANLMALAQRQRSPQASPDQQSYDNLITTSCPQAFPAHDYHVNDIPDENFTTTVDSLWGPLWR